MVNSFENRADLWQNNSSIPTSSILAPINPPARPSTIISHSIRRFTWLGKKVGTTWYYAGKSSNTPRQFGQKLVREDDYRKLFSEYSGETLIGESSPHYLVSEQARERIHEVRPDAKLIAILRNPADAIYSRYLMRCRDGSITQSFSQVLQGEEQVLAGKGDRSRLHLATAFYGQCLVKYYERFPVDQIKVQLYEDYLQDRPGQLSDLFTFLGVDPSFTPPDQRHYNSSGVPRQGWLSLLMKYRRSMRPLVKRLVPAEVRARVMDRLFDGLDRPTKTLDERQRLVEIYREDIVRLEGLLRRDLRHWLGE
jgi:hypothetical protein